MVTLNLLNNYYTGIATKIPRDKPIPKDILPKISIDDAFTIKEVNICLKEITEGKCPNPLTSEIQEIPTKCLNFITKTEHNEKALHRKMKTIVFPTAGTTKKNP